MITLRTKRLLLREFALADLPAYTALRDDPEFHAGHPDSAATAPTSDELLRRFVRWAAEIPRLRYQLAIENSDVGLMGSVGVRIVDQAPVRHRSDASLDGRTGAGDTRTKRLVR